MLAALSPASSAQDRGDAAATTRGARGTTIATAIAESARPLENESESPREEVDLFAEHLDLSRVESRRFLALGRLVTAAELRIRADESLRPRFGGLFYSHQVPGVIQVM